jgi:L-asparaginase
MNRLFLVLCLAGVVLAAPTAAQDRPRVHLVATGGTISNRDGGRLTAEQIVALVPNAERYATLTAEQFTNTASGALTIAQYIALSRRINELYRADSTLAGIVVTMGTDTMEELAYFLHLTVRDPRPVVVVGAMRNPSQVGFEGPANLLSGVRVAADAAARGVGTVVVLNDEINAARDVVKTDARRLHTFNSRDVGVLGVVDSDRVAWYRRTVQRHSARSEFDVFAFDSLPRVDILLAYQGAPGDLFNAAVDAGAKGIIIAAAGAGAISGTQSVGQRYAIDKGVFVVTTTRTGAGRITPAGPLRDTTNVDAVRRRRFTLAGEDLEPLKARLLLMLGLATTTDRETLQRYFREY